MELIIRKEKEKDYFEAEAMTRRAFWNLHRAGCDEHYLVHKMRRDPAYLPELSLIAEADGKIAGGIYYMRSCVKGDDAEFPTLIFGPLCVDPAYQNRGIGGRLIRESAALARQAGYKAIIIFGEPDYYPRYGFLTCDHFGITTADGENFSAFMALELVPGGLKGITGKYYYPKVYDDLPPEEVDAFDRQFPYLEKKSFPASEALAESLL